MKLSTVLTVWKKEVVDLLRDRRTLLSMFVLPIVVFPLLFSVMGKFMGEAEKKAELEATTVAVPATGLPAEFDAVIAKSGLKPIPLADPAVAVRDNKAATGIDVSTDGRSVRVFAEGTRQSSSIAAEKLRTSLAEWKDTLVARKLAEANLDRGVLSPFTVKRENVASERRMGGFLLGSILGYVVILLMFSGGMYPAIDMTAGEKERKTLEGILASPARRTDLVLGKVLACVSVTYATALLTVISLFYSLKRGGLGMKGMEPMSGNIPTDPGTISLMLLTLLPVAVMAGALMVAIALAARSSKEAQSYLTPLIMLVIFPALLGGLPGMESSPLVSLVPVLNASQALRAILQGEPNPLLLLITNGANILYASLCFAIAVRQFNNEKVLFRT